MSGSSTSSSYLPIAVGVSVGVNTSLAASTHGSHILIASLAGCLTGLGVGIAISKAVESDEEPPQGNENK
ncbi:hypothetical protein [Spirillospora sp. CA-128828]|uniref:hypothetical protein n=1 Tax=Spirillospora sp. CA-128828 TaxID=3240033 RepID=UPI003D901516